MYSPIEHIAKALHLSRWKDCWFAMYTVYGDASGSEDRDRATVVACFMHSVQGWIEWDIEWQELLKAYDVPYLHMREFAHSVGPFAKWKGDERIRRAFLGNALDIIVRSGAMNFATVVDSAAFTQFEARHGVRHTLLSSYLFAARVCFSSITGWCRENRVNAPVEYVFEQGDPNQNMLRTIAKVDHLPEPIFRPKIDDDPQRTVRPLQAADLLAYEIVKGYRDVGKRPLREPLKRLERTTHDWGIYDESNIDKLVPISDAVGAIEAVLSADKENPPG